MPGLRLLRWGSGPWKELVGFWREPSVVAGPLLPSLKSKPLPKSNSEARYRPLPVELLRKMVILVSREPL